MRFDFTKFKTGAFLLAALLMLPLWSASAQGEEIALEYKVKTAFVHNFIPYIHWPEDTFKSASEPVRITVIGTSPLARAIPTLEGKMVTGREIKIHIAESINPAQPPHLLVVCESEKARYQEILQSVANQTVLTIGNSSDFSDQGGVIGFYLQEDKVRFTINLTAAHTHNLKISSKLLRLATIIE